MLANAQAAEEAEKQRQHQRQLNDLYGWGHLNT
jgi:hypothetical protein